MMNNIDGIEIPEDLDRSFPDKAMTHSVEM
jgi:hypothetical protein